MAAALVAPILAILASFTDAAQPVLSVLAPAQAALAWTVGCFTLHWTLLYILFPSRSSKLLPSRRLDLANTAVASVHAAIMFVGAVQHAAPLWDAGSPLSLLRPTAVRPNSAIQNLWCERMLGYLLYDCLVGLSQKLEPLIWVHHLLGVVSLGSIRLLNCGGSYLMLVHLAEGSTPFLHAATSLHALGCTNWHLYRVSALFTLLNFTLLRAFIQPQVWWHLVHSRQLWGAENEALWVGEVIVDGCFVLLNLFWWTKLLARAFGRGGKRKSSGKGRGEDAAPEAAHME